MASQVAQSAWGQDLIQIQIPLPNALKWVNSYLVRGTQGYTLIDPGQHTADALEAWRAAMSELHISMKDIEQIVLTHHHPDHYGLAGWFQEQTGGVPVYMTETAHVHTQMMWGTDQTATGALDQLFARHGMDASIRAEIRDHFDSFIAYVSPQPEVTYIEQPQFRLGDRDWQVILTNGHASGHACFYHAASREMLCGDQILPQISPNISYIPGSDPQPLQSFIESLTMLQAYDVAIAYPGHRHPFRHYQERIADLLEHHEERLQKFVDLLTEPMTAYECCLAVFNVKLTVHQLRFAMSETLAHLIELERRGLVRTEENTAAGCIQYKRA
ncbi:MBL fold metallo-hydrolase [Paenibacillus guangzhouensis]|uniref:MBL fold metallo-hydrolase n=1 Tax=Paenibacillus guangzhouensis TaxID=1473112 RepID=UPI001266D90E|nr:MBL fold metallo-hydrolase [Paenibacillus guangzhouensis]